jgi:hypothetical protein
VYVMCAAQEDDEDQCRAPSLANTYPYIVISRRLELYIHFFVHTKY